MVQFEDSCTQLYAYSVCIYDTRYIRHAYDTYVRPVRTNYHSSVMMQWSLHTEHGWNHGGTRILLAAPLLWRFRNVENTLLNQTEQQCFSTASQMLLSHALRLQSTAQSLQEEHHQLRHLLTEQKPKTLSLHLSLLLSLLSISREGAFTWKARQCFALRHCCRPAYYYCCRYSGFSAPQVSLGYELVCSFCRLKSKEFNFFLLLHIHLCACFLLSVPVGDMQHIQQCPCPFFILTGWHPVYTSYDVTTTQIRTYYVAMQ